MKKILDYIMDEGSYFDSDVDGWLCSYVYDYVFYVEKISKCVGFRMSCVRKWRRSYCEIVKTFEWV